MFKKDFAFLDDGIKYQAVIDFMDKCKRKKRIFILSK